MSAPATDVYEIVHQETGRTKRWFRPDLVGAVIMSVRRITDGEEVFRHIEEMDDDEGHLLYGISKDLATMTVSDFEARWL